MRGAQSTPPCHPPSCQRRLASMRTRRSGTKSAWTPAFAGVTAEDQSSPPASCQRRLASMRTRRSGTNSAWTPACAGVTAEDQSSPPSSCQRSDTRHPSIRAGLRRGPSPRLGPYSGRAEGKRSSIPRHASEGRLCSLGDPTKSMARLAGVTKDQSSRHMMLCSSGVHRPMRMPAWRSARPVHSLQVMTKL